MNLVSFSREGSAREEIRGIRNLFFIESAIFFSTFFLGTFTLLRIKYILETQNVSLQPINIPDFLFSFFVSTLFILFLVFLTKRKKRGEVIFKIVFALGVFLGETITLSAFLGSFLSILLAILSLIIWFKKPLVIFHNLLLILSLSGIGAVLGMRIKSELIVILLLIFSLYDFIAVYKTKHMQKMARAMIKASAPLAFIISPNPKSLLSDNISDNINLDNGKKRNVFFLGGGDIVFPLILCYSLALRNIFYSFFVAIFSFLGLSFSFYIFFFQRRKKPIPALPPIALFTLIGFFIGGIIFKVKITF